MTIPDRIAHLIGLAAPKAKRWLISILIASACPLVSGCDSDKSGEAVAEARQVSENVAAVSALVELHSADTKWVKRAFPNRVRGGIPTALLEDSLIQESPVLLFISPRDFEHLNPETYKLDGRVSLKIGDFYNIRNIIELDIKKTLMDKLRSENDIFHDRIMPPANYIAVIAKVRKIDVVSEVRDGDTVKVRLITGDVIDAIYVGDAKVANAVADQLYDIRK